MRSLVGTARRVVVKVGSSSLTAAEGGLDASSIAALVDALATVHAQGREVVLVSSGAIAAGMTPLGMRTRPRDLASQQAAASVGQGLLVEQYARQFARHGIAVGQVLLTVDDLTRQSTYRNAYRTLGRLLELGVVPVVNENDTVATHEIRFGDNDRLAALVAHLVQADALVLLSDVDAVYTAHPSEPGARRIEEVTPADAAALEAIDTSRRGSGVGTGGMTTKLQAAHIAATAGVPVVLAHADAAADALAGRPVGTYFHAAGKRRPTRLLWLAHASSTRGELLLDEGAVRAITEGHASLLPAGVTAVRGSFEAGDPVSLVRAVDGVVVGRGIVNYDAADLPPLLGRSTRELAAELGAQYERELVHRDALVLTGRRRKAVRTEGVTE